MVTFEHIDKFVLTNLNLHIPEGEIVGIIGPSGAGKTTLLKLACGLLKPEAGSVYVMGKHPGRSRFQRKQMSAFFAGVPCLCKEDTVKNGFELLRYVYQISREQFLEDYGKLAAGLGFEAFQEKKINGLSLGQKMRAELGAALVVRPRLLLLDEPVVGLDVNGKAALHDILLKRVSRGMTAVITSHDMAEVSKLCSRIVVLDGGELLYYGSEERLQKYFMPIHSMRVIVTGKYPDLEDLPLTSYSQENNVFTLNYNAEYITAAEILRLILSQTKIGEVTVSKPDLERIITQFRKRKGDMHGSFY